MGDWSDGWLAASTTARYGLRAGASRRYGAPLPRAQRSGQEAGAHFCRHVAQMRGGLLLWHWHGAQLAADATLGSRVSREVTDALGIMHVCVRAPGNSHTMKSMINSS